MIAVHGFAQSADLSFWAVDCRLLDSEISKHEKADIVIEIQADENGLDIPWFLMDESATDKSPIQFCAGWKCIPYPGFWEYFELRKDPRINWIGPDKLELANSDKDAGWDGFKTFNRCEVRETP